MSIVKAKEIATMLKIKNTWTKLKARSSLSLTNIEGKKRQYWEKQAPKTIATKWKQRQKHNQKFKFQAASKRPWCLQLKIHIEWKE